MDERPFPKRLLGSGALRVVSLSLLGMFGISGVVVAVEHFLNQDVPRAGTEKYLSVAIDAPFGSVSIKEGAQPGNVASIQSFDEGDEKPHFEYKLKNSIFGILRIGVGTGDGQGQLQQNAPFAMWHASTGLSLAGGGGVQSDAGRMRNPIVRQFHEPQPSLEPITPFYFVATDAVMEKKEIARHGSETKIFLNRELPMNFRADLGFGESFVDLSDLPVMSAEISSGANQTTIVSRTPNTRNMSVCRIDAGIGQCNVLGIGNLNPEHFYFNGGFGSYHLAFDGEQHRDMEATVQVGLGKCHITIPPRSARVQVFYDDGLLSSYDFSGLTRRRDGYATSVGFDNSHAPILTLRLETGMGKISVSYH